MKADVRAAQKPSISPAEEDDKNLAIDDVKEELTNIKSEADLGKKAKDVLLSTNCSTEYLQHKDFAPLLEVCNSINQTNVPEGESKFQYFAIRYSMH